MISYVLYYISECKFYQVGGISKSKNGDILLVQNSPLTRLARLRNVFFWNDRQSFYLSY